jgi:purine-binding chemotaxis protein CheW
MTQSPTNQMISPSLPQGDIRRILEERARELARSNAPDIPHESLELLVFTTARERLAVETRFVVGVFKIESLTPLPGADAPVHGLTAWRGEVLALLDVRPFFGARSTALDDLARAVVVSDGRSTYGLLADEIDTIVSVPLPDVFPIPLSTDAAPAREYMRGITRDAVLVLDVERLLETL